MGVYVLFGQMNPLYQMHPGTVSRKFGPFSWVAESRGAVIAADSDLKKSVPPQVLAMRMPDGKWSLTEDENADYSDFLIIPE